MTSASDPLTFLHSACILSANSSDQKLEPKAILAAGDQQMSWWDEVGLCGPCPIFEKRAKLNWVFTGASNDKMYIEIYKDFYINLIKQ